MSSYVEQKRIVAVIDAALARLANAKARVDAMLHQLPILRAGLHDAAVSGRMDTAREEDGRAVIVPREGVASRTRSVISDKFEAQGAMPMLAVEEALRAAGRPLEAQELAALTGIASDAEIDEVEWFYSQLTALDRAGRLTRTDLFDDFHRKVGEALTFVEA